MTLRGRPPTISLPSVHSIALIAFIACRRFSLWPCAHHVYPTLHMTLFSYASLMNWLIYTWAYKLLRVHAQEYNTLLFSSTPIAICVLREGAANESGTWESDKTWAFLSLTRLGGPWWLDQRLTLTRPSQIDIDPRQDISTGKQGFHQSFPAKVVLMHKYTVTHLLCAPTLSMYMQLGSLTR